MKKLRSRGHLFVTMFCILPVYIATSDIHSDDIIRTNKLNELMHTA